MQNITNTISITEIQKIRVPSILNKNRQKQHSNQFGSSQFSLLIQIYCTFGWSLSSLSKWIISLTDQLRVGDIGQTESIFGEEGCGSKCYVSISFIVLFFSILLCSILFYSLLLIQSLRISTLSTFNT